MSDTRSEAGGGAWCCGAATTWFASRSAEWDASTQGRHACPSRRRRLQPSLSSPNMPVLKLSHISTAKAQSMASSTAPKGVLSLGHACVGARGVQQVLCGAFHLHTRKRMHMCARAHASHMLNKIHVKCTWGLFAPWQVSVTGACSRSLLPTARSWLGFRRRAGRAPGSQPAAISSRHARWHEVALSQVSKLVLLSQGAGSCLARCSSRRGRAPARS